MDALAGLQFKGPLEVFAAWERSAPERVFLREARGGAWKDWTYRQAGLEIRRMASYLRSQGYAPGSPIGILAKNSAHWILADLAIWMSGNVSVPIYPNLTAHTVGEIIGHSGIKLLFVGKLDGWEKMRAGIPEGLPLISFPSQPRAGADSWEQAILRHAPLMDVPTRRLDEMATIVYTSGTTGQPKGVMHNFRSFAFSGSAILNELKVGPSDRFFSYLPLAHAAERLVVETVGLYSGAQIYFAEGLESFAQDLKRCQPTIFLAVPRIWSKFQSQIQSKFPPPRLRALLRVPGLAQATRLFLRKQLGLDKARLTLTGASPMPPSTKEWFAENLGLELLEAYGLTENLAYSHFTRSRRSKMGWLGQPWPGVEAKLSTENGELLLKSPCLMTGYYKDPEQSAQALAPDGFLRTGDLAEIDSEGFMRITGRAKELFKTSKGKYVAPSPIELSLSNSEHIDQVCVLGSGFPQPMALIVLSSRSRKQASRSNVEGELRQLLKTTNMSLDQHERLSKLVVVSETWSSENGFLTPSLKVKRSHVEESYRAALEAWASEKDSVIWTQPAPPA